MLETKILPSVGCTAILKRTVPTLAQHPEPFAQALLPFLEERVLPLPGGPPAP